MSVLVRQSLALLSLLVLAAGCSSGASEGDIAFETVFSPSTDASVWTATGEAIDDGLLCPSAAGILEGFEDEDGVARTEDDFASLVGTGEPFVSVSVDSMTCDDGSGDFTLRFINEVDPSRPEGTQIVASTWTITGGSGYDTTSGEGTAEESTTAFMGTGTITKE
jgi:hypothetical protein